MRRRWRQRRADGAVVKVVVVVVQLLLGRGSSGGGGRGCLLRFLGRFGDVRQGGGQQGADVSGGELPGQSEDGDLVFWRGGEEDGCVMN